MNKNSVFFDESVFFFDEMHKNGYIIIINNEIIMNLINWHNYRNY